jgi:hypothetical protein
MNYKKYKIELSIRIKWNNKPRIMCAEFYKTLYSGISWKLYFSDIDDNKPTTSTLSSNSFCLQVLLNEL